MKIIRIDHYVCEMIVKSFLKIVNFFKIRCCFY